MQGKRNLVSCQQGLVNVPAPSGDFSTSVLKVNSTQITSSVDSESRVTKILGCGSWDQGMRVAMEGHKDKISSMCHYK